MSAKASGVAPGAFFGMSTGAGGLNNPANWFTLSRVPMAIGAAFLGYSTNHDWLAIIIIGVAGSTDMLDGVVARLTGCTSELGGVLDPIADKLYMFVVIYWLGYIVLPENKAMFYAIVAAEVLLAAQAIGAKMMNVSISVSWWGKWAISFKMFAVGTMLVAQSLDSGWSVFMPIANYVAALGIVLSVITFLVYVWQICTTMASRR